MSNSPIGYHCMVSSLPNSPIDPKQKMTISKESRPSIPEDPAVIANGTCGSCGTVNLLDAKFCSGCGQSLIEDCGECGKPVFLTQVFCGECGADLSNLLAKKRQKYADLLAEAKVAGSKFKFPEAKRLLNRITGVTDYRFDPITSTAARTLKKVCDLEKKTLQKVSDACEKAREANERGQTQEVIEQLQRIPEHLLNENSKHLIDSARSHQSLKAELESELKKEIDAKNWKTVGILVNELLEIEPFHESAKRLAKQVAEKLVESAKRSSSWGQFDQALDKLKAIPDCEQNQTIKDQLSDAADQQWIYNELNSEPFLSPTLERLLTALRQTCPDLKTLNENQNQIQQLKSRPRSPNRSHLIEWKGSAKCWTGGTVAALTYPQSLKCETPAAFKKHPGSFSVAIGLAMQAVGEARVTEDFLIRKKSLFSSGKKPAVSAWGLDVGTASVKGVLIERRDNDLHIVDSFLEEVNSSRTLGKDPNEERKSLLPLVNKFIEEKQPGDTPLWSNFNNSQTVSRYLRLPPVKTKEASTLLDKEIEAKIPIPLDELVVTKWICRDKRLPILGRPAMISTAKRDFIMRRTSLLESLGLKIAGLQSDSIALINFAAREFSDVLPNIEAMKSDEIDVMQKDLSRAVCIIDAGASSTHLILVSAEAHWSMSIATGGEDLTFQIASSANATRKDAESFKRNPTKLPRFAMQYQPIEARLDTMRSRLETMYRDALKQDNPFKPVSTWCVGGAWQTYQWIRRVMT